MTPGYFDDPRPDIQRLISPPDGCRILDVGCGAGALGDALRRAGAALVAGVERHPDAAATARNRLDLLVEGDVATASLPFTPNSFDVVVFADLLEHVADPEAAVRRYLPYLAPGGRVVISVPNMRFYTVLLRLLVDRWEYAESGVRDRTHLRVFTRRSLLALHAAVGLRVDELDRRYRLFEDQSRIGRVGALLSRLACATVAPLLLRDLMAFQYIAVSRLAAARVG